MRSINSLVQSTDEGVGNVKTSIENAFTKTKTLSESVLGGFIKGFTTIYSLFSRKSRLLENNFPVIVFYNM